MAQQPPPIGADVTALMPAVGEDVTALMGGADAPGAGPAMNFAVVNGQRVPVTPAAVLKATDKALTPAAIADLLESWLTGTPKPAAQPAAPVPPAAPAEPETKPADRTGLESLGAFAGEATQGVNPVSINRMVQSAFWDPLGTIKGIGAAQGHVGQQAIDAFRAGDPVKGSAKLIEWLIPFLGPRLSQSGDYFQSGDVAKGAGAAVDVGLQAFGPKAIETVAAGRRVPVKPELGPANPQEAAAIAAMQARGVPIKLGVAAGDNLARTVQKGVDTTFGGSLVAKLSEAEEAAALTRVGRELAEQAGPGPAQDAVAAGTQAQALLKAQAAAEAQRLAGAAARLRQRVVPGASRTASEAAEGLGRTLQGQAAQEAMSVDAGAGTIAEAAAPVSQSGYRSAESMMGRVQEVVRGWYQDRRAAYSTLEKAEQSRANQDLVPGRGVSPEARAAKQAETVGHPLAPEVISELERIQAELEALPYRPATWGEVEYGPLTGNAGGGHYNRVPGSAGAAVYDDIAKGLDRATVPERADMEGMIGRAIQTGDFSGDTARAALDVARRRLAGDKTLATNGELPPGAKVPPRTEAMGLAVDLRAARQALRPIYEDLAAQAELTPMTFVGGKAQALQALRRLMTGPDHAPLTVVDGALSDLKAAARGSGGLPELRTEGQGVAARMVGALETAVRQRAAAAGPEVLQALLDGRAAHKAMVEAGELFEGFSESPTKVFDQLFAKRDTNLPVLKAVAKQVPDAVPGMGRAWWEQTIDAARDPKTGVINVDKVRKSWTALGEQTKAFVFSEEVRANVDAYLAQDTPAAGRAAKAPSEPMALYERLTAARDGHAQELETFAQQAPREVQTIAGTWLDRAFAQASTGGRFDPAVFKKGWDDLGPRTRAALFGDDAAQRPLERFGDIPTRAAEAADLPKEPVQALDLFTTGRPDHHYAQLDAVLQVAPELRPILARRFLEQGLESATAEGNFSRARTLATRWRNLGQATKRRLYPDAGLRTALDHFHVVAERIAENPNPSQSALTGSVIAQLLYTGHNPVVGVGAQIGLGVLAKAMRTEAGVKLLTQGMTVPVSSAAAPLLVRRILQAAGEPTEEKEPEPAAAH